MKLQDQVCTKEQGQRLETLGIKPGIGLYYWYELYHSDEAGTPYYVVADFDEQRALQIGYSSAFTVAELSMMLPIAIKDTSGKHHYLKIQPTETWGKVNKGWQAEYHITFEPPKVAPVRHDELSETLAALLIHLLEISLLTPDEVNNRLATS